MQPTGRIVGTRRAVSDVAAEYASLAKGDEIAAERLYECGSYRQAAYYFVQAMEKQVWVEIFKRVNPQEEYFRERSRTHNIDDLLAQWIEILAYDPIVQEAVRDQLERLVLVGVRFGRLHNDLRYPFFFEPKHTYFITDVTRADVDLLRDKLHLLVKFLSDGYRLVGAH